MLILRASPFSLFNSESANLKFVKTFRKGGDKVDFSITEKALVLILLIILALKSK